MATAKANQGAQEGGHILLTGSAVKEEGQFASFCPELAVASCGNSVEESFANLGDAIEVYLKGLVETGELLNVLRERNIRVDLDAPTGDYRVPVQPVEPPTNDAPIYQFYRQPVPLAT